MPCYYLITGLIIRIKTINPMHIYFLKSKQTIESHWKQPSPILSLVLMPIAFLYRTISKIRYWLYYLNIFTSQQHTVPIIVIGNLQVGGTGKTPCVIALSQELTHRNFKVGIVSRGYGRISHKTLLVNIHGTTQNYGDEPLLIAQKTGCPTAVSSKRNIAIQFLIQHFPDIDIIISDDGLQHYPMQRDIEIVVFPYDDIHKPAKLLPNGPFRESLKRLQSISFIVVSNTPHHHMNEQQVRQSLGCNNSNIFFSSIQLDNIYPLNNYQQSVQPSFFQQKQVVAVCAIANPERFFHQLQLLGIKLSDKIILSDHEILPVKQLAKQYAYIIITEKDAVKIHDSSIHNVFVVSVTINIAGNFIDSIMQTITTHYHRKSHGQKTT